MSRCARCTRNRADRQYSLVGRGVISQLARRRSLSHLASQPSNSPRLLAPAYVLKALSDESPLVLLMHYSYTPLICFLDSRLGHSESPLLQVQPAASSRHLHPPFSVLLLYSSLRSFVRQQSSRSRR